MAAVGNETVQEIEFQKWFTEEASRNIVAKSLQSLSLVVLFLFAFLGNGSVVYVLYKNFTITNIPNLLLFCLTLVNLCIAILNIPLAVISTAADEWLFGDSWCDVSGFLNQYLTSTSIAMITVIALYRYQAIANTFSAQITFRGVKWIVLYALFYCLVFTSPPLFGWNMYRFSRSKGFCTLDWQVGGSGLVYTILALLTCFLSPFIIIVFIYVRIGVVTQYNPRPEPVFTRTSNTNGIMTRDVKLRHTQGSSNRFSSRSESGSKDSIQESKTISSVSYVLMTFVLFLAPYYVMNIASAFSQDALSPAVDFTVAWLQYCHAAAVPIVYGYMNRRIRNFLVRLPWWPTCPGCCDAQA